MSECLAKDYCPMKDDLVELGIARCEDELGHEACGAAVAYCSILEGYGEYSNYDQQHPIMGKFEIRQIPNGNAPEEIRRQWLGVELPVRYIDILPEGVVQVSSADAISSLLAHGKIKAALWFFNNRRDDIVDELLVTDGFAFAPRWQFQLSDGFMIPNVEPIRSLDFYGSKVTPEIREKIEITEIAQSFRSYERD